MKQLILVLLFAFALRSNAAAVSLKGGETVTIQANTSTTVSCNATDGGNNPHVGDCHGAGAAFLKSMEACYRSFSGGTCVDKLWPKYKAANPNCVYAGIETCLEYCEKSSSSGTCAEKCL